MGWVVNGGCRPRDGRLSGRGPYHILHIFKTRQVVKTPNEVVIGVTLILRR